MDGVCPRFRLQRIVSPALRAFKPDLILVSSGEHWDGSCNCGGDHAPRVAMVTGFDAAFLDTLGS